jgi:hypothetical protein
MKFKVTNDKGFNIPTLMRHLGYHPFRDSYSRRLGAGHYPKFHIYVDDHGLELMINLHLDQKKASYQNQVAHSGDYEDNERLDEEKKRIITLLEAI